MNARSRREVVLSAVAMTSPAGENAALACAALRAGVARLRQHPFVLARPPEWPPEEPELARAAFIPGPGVGAPLGQRLMQLGLAPAREVLARCRLQRADLSDTGFLMSLPSTAGGRPRLASAAEFQASYLDRLGIEPSIVCDPRETGTSGMIAALAEGVGRIEKGEVRRALVMGVESYLDPETMDWLDTTGRLHSHRNPDGFVPGEAAVHLLIELAEEAEARGVPPLAKVSGIAVASEDAPIISDRFATGSGLSAAILSATAAATPLSRNLWTIGDLNGQSYRGQEWGVVKARLASRWPSLGPLWHPADCVGDVGAAAGGLQIALATHGFSRKRPPGEAALVWCSAEGGERAACVLLPPSGG